MSAVPFLACPDTPRPRTAWTTSRRCALLGALVLATSDCWYSVEHSAGAGLANYAARQLQRTRRRRIVVALLDPVLGPILSLWPVLRQPALYPPVPAGVAMTVYIAREPRTLDPDRQPGDAATAADLPHV